MVVLAKHFKCENVVLRIKAVNIVRANSSRQIFREVKMGKYIAYIICIIGILFALEYFKIVDVPYLDLPDLQTKGEQIKEKSEDNMRRRFGDWNDSPSEKQTLNRKHVILYPSQFRYFRFPGLWDRANISFEYK